VALGLWLQRKGIATAAMDLSDGLSSDLARLCRASGVSARLDGALPVFPGASEADALHGGDDYELLFTAPPSARVPKAVAGLPVTRIGEVMAGNAGRVFLGDAELAPAGWDHFVS
jgi:thiamine-monophosphate kinase